MMSTGNTLEIPLNKKKIRRHLFVLLIFLIIGINFLLNTSLHDGTYSNFFYLMKGIGILLLPVFFLEAMRHARQLFSSEPGFRISSEGVHDNASGVSVGFIPWKDIKDLKKLSAFNTKYLIILLHHPDDYINRSRNFIQKMRLKSNLRSYKSPVIMSADFLEVDFDNFFETVVHERNKWMTLTDEHSVFHA